VTTLEDVGLRWALSPFGIAVDCLVFPRNHDDLRAPTTITTAL